MNRGASQGGQLAAISGLALILIMFLFAWFGVDSADVNGLDAFDALDDWVDLILVFAAFSGMALGLVAVPRINLPASLSVITAVLGAISAILILIYLISPPSFPTFGSDTALNVDLGRKIGVWLGLLAAIGVAAGGYLSMQEEGTSFQDTADRFSRGRGAGEPPPPGGPPRPPSEPPSAPPAPPPPPPPPPPPSGPGV
jgi:hypothetical protein